MPNKQDAAARLGIGQVGFVASAPALWHPLDDTSFGRVNEVGDLIAVARVRVRRCDAVAVVERIREAMESAAGDHRIYTRSVDDLVLGAWSGFSVADLLVSVRDSELFLTERAAVLLAHESGEITVEVDANTPYLDAIPDLGAEVQALAASVQLADADA
ncbi:hypothetical protein [Nocardioides sp. SR21]|uniref:hypothetical protein n=1 Tax=Nocardioides sp. SR21 TaxID=2919501 RepID=UPI001FA9AF8F|nr:hypothetical protein [Nocardioides sp. SR21]